MHKIVAIALDACDPGLARAFAQRGLMPNLARLLGEASHCHVRNPFALFVNAIWMNYATSLLPPRHGFHSWDKVDPATYERCLNPPPRLAHPTFWKQMSDAGCSVAAIDVPHQYPSEGLNGFEITEWGCHDRHHAFASSPPDLAARIEATYGLHPVFGWDAHREGDFAADDWIHRAAAGQLLGAYRTIDEEKALLRGFLEGAAIKRQLTLDMLRERDWDFFISVFGESHGAGHQLWHLHDPHHPRYDAAAVAALGGDPIAQVYAALDDAVGRIAEEIGPETLLIVHLSHGMGPHYDATHLLDEVLARLDRHASGSGAPRLRDWTKRLAAPMVEPLRRVARIVPIPAGLRRTVGSSLEVAELATPEARARQRFFLAPNNTVYGGIRFNVSGREPDGIVRPDEVMALAARLEADLLDLRDAATGEPVIKAVFRCEDYHARSPDDALPDLLIEWTRLSQVESVTSPKIGVVRAPYRGWRTGDHRPDGLLLLRGAGYPAGATIPSIAMEDIGPSLAQRLGVTLAGVDGAPAAWLAHGPAAIEASLSGAAAE